MADLIDRQAAIEAITVDGYEHFSGCLSSSEERLLELMIDTLRELPVVDAVEVPKDNADDMNRAIIGLGMFRLSFCLNVRETDVQGEPVFRCEECPFEDKKARKCAVKIFLNKNATEEQRHKFLPIV